MRRFAKVTFRPLAAVMLAAAVSHAHAAPAPKVKWEARVPDTVEGNINVADLRGNGQWDVLFNTRDYGIVFCLDAQGRERWRYEPPEQVRLCASVAVLEEPASGKKRVLSLSRDGWLYCLDAEGRVSWQRKLWAGSLYGGPVMATDATGETVIAVTGEDGRVHNLTPEGAIRWVFACPNSIYDPAAVGDVDGDGRAEVLWGCKDDFFYCLASDGRMKWRIKTGAENASGPILIDLDGNGSIEALFGSWDRNLYCAEGKTGRVLWQAPSDGQITNSTAAADLDGDGRPEVLYGGHKKLFCVDAGGKPKWTFVPQDAEEMIVSYPPVVGDVTGDGRPEVIFGSKNGTLYCLSAKGELVWSRSISLVNIVSGPALHDIDNDGLLEIVYATSGGDVICLATRGSARTKAAWPLGRVHATLNANLGPLGLVAEGVETASTIPHGSPAGGTRAAFDGVLNVQQSQEKKEGPVIDWLMGQNYASFADIGRVRLYTESRDAERPLRGNLEMTVTGDGKQTAEFLMPLEPPSGSAVIEVSLPDLLTDAGEQRVDARLLDDAGGVQAHTVLEVSKVLRAPLRQQAARLLDRLQDEEGKGLDAPSRLSVELMRRLIGYAQVDLEGMELERARQILSQIDARLSKPGPLGGAPATAPSNPDYA
ncbi:MAG TPA: FG-GAP-like repeat-containing protein [Armatimonadota bacterium]|nr:FG-GAP-like repeat-containing protein [Armatimonadota bacterium]